MSRVFIIGLLVPLRARLALAAQRHDIDIGSVLADVGREGTMQLLPYPGQAVVDFDTYLDSLDDWANARVIVLPYAAIPSALVDVIEMVIEAGGYLLEPTAGEDGWPLLAKRKKPDASFQASLFGQLANELFPSNVAIKPPLPTACLRAAQGRHQQLLVVDEVFDLCDQMAAHRYRFVERALNSFVCFLEQGGDVGRIDAFFSASGLIHAQSGGINVTVNVYVGARCVQTQTTQTHLKQGDKTTAHAAARIYYCTFMESNVRYLVVLYVGPHPEVDITRTVTLGDARNI
jgi:hypothetical protein